VSPLQTSEFTIEAFEAGDIDTVRFDHEAHVYVGWLYIHEFGITTAILRFEAALRRLVALKGAEDKYHATLTWFFLLLIYERSEVDEPWHTFRQRNADLVNGSKGLLAHYYTNMHLFSERARERFVLPDNLAKR